MAKIPPKGTTDTFLEIREVPHGWDVVVEVRSLEHGAGKFAVKEGRAPEDAALIFALWTLAHEARHRRLPLIIPGAQE